MLSDFWAFLRDVPDAIVRWCNKWTLQQHGAEDVGLPELMCLRCKVAWPCDGYVVASDRLIRRLSGTKLITGRTSST